jgi:hypothetical protein
VCTEKVIRIVPGRESPQAGGDPWPAQLKLRSAVAISSVRFWPSMKPRRCSSSKKARFKPHPAETLASNPGDRSAPLAAPLAATAPVAAYGRPRIGPGTTPAGSWARRGTAATSRSSPRRGGMCCASSSRAASCSPLAARGPITASPAPSRTATIAREAAKNVAAQRAKNPRH